MRFQDIFQGKCYVRAFCRIVLFFANGSQNVITLLVGTWVKEEKIFHRLHLIKEERSVLVNISSFAQTSNLKSRNPDEAGSRMSACAGATALPVSCPESRIGGDEG